MIRARVQRRIVGIAAVAILAAGCGGAAKSALHGGNELAGAAGTKGLGANVMPAGVLAFGDANIDVSSAGWKRALALGAKFPGFGRLVLQFDKSLNERTGNGPTGAEIRSALGGEIAIGVTDLKAGASGSEHPGMLIYAEVKDAAKIKGWVADEKNVTALPGRGGFDVYSQKGDDGTNSFLAISSSSALFSNEQSALESAIDRSAGGNDRLADSPEFKDAMKTLPDENILVGYVGTAALKQLGETARSQGGAADTALAKKQIDDALAAYQAVKGIAYSVDATTGGFRLRSSVRIDESKLASLGDAAKQFQSFEPTLLSRIPSTAYFAASFQNLGPTLNAAYGSILEQPGVFQGKVTQFEGLLGVKLDDLVALTSGEHALFIGPGLPATGGLLLKPADAAKGADTLRAITKLLAARGVAVHDTGDGQDATLGTFSGRWRKVDGVLAIGTDATVGDTVKDPLFESDAVKKLFADAGLDAGAKTAGAVYLDVPKVVDMVSSLGALSSASTDQEAIDNLRHLGGIVAWTARDGDLAVSDVFIGVK